MRTRATVALVVPALLAAFGCGSPSPSAPSRSNLIVGPIQVDSLEIVRNASSSSGLGVRVQGVLGDGCSDLLPPITEQRAGSVIRISIQKQRPKDAICTQIAKLFDQVVPLLGDYPAGEYVVHVNASDLTFRVP